MNALHYIISEESNGTDLMYLLGMAKAFFDNGYLSGTEYVDIVEYLYKVRGEIREEI